MVKRPVETRKFFVPIPPQKGKCLTKNKNNKVKSHTDGEHFPSNSKERRKEPQVNKEVERISRKSDINQGSSIKE